MSFFKNLRAELGTAAGKGLANLAGAILTKLWEAIVWLFKWQHRGSEPEPKTNSFRMAAWSIILAIIFMPGLVTCSNTNNQSQNNYSGNNTNSGATRVTVQLREGEEPIIPLDEDFRTLPYGVPRQYVVIENKKYYKYNEARNADDYPSVVIDEISCQIVPAGRELKIYTTRRPLNAVNMELILQRAVRPETASHISRLSLLLNEFTSGEPLLLVEKHGWKQTFDSWRDTYPLNGNLGIIKVKAQSKENNPSGTPGGLVCF